MVLEKFHCCFSETQNNGFNMDFPSFHLSQAEVANTTNNDFYPNRIKIETVSELREVIERDYVGPKYNEDRRNDFTNFLETDVLVIEIKNDNPRHPEEHDDPHLWKSAKECSQDFVNYTHVIITSPDHLISVNGRAARPVFYIIFPLEGMIRESSRYHEFVDKMYNAYKRFDGLCYFFTPKDNDFRGCLANPEAEILVNTGAGNLVYTLTNSDLILPSTPKEYYELLSDKYPETTVFVYNDETYALSPKIKKIASFFIRILYSLKTKKSDLESDVSFMLRFYQKDKTPITIPLKPSTFSSHSDFKKMMVNYQLIWHGNPKDLTILYNYLLELPFDEVRSIGNIGYDKESDCYVFGDILFDSKGELERINDWGYFDSANLKIAETVETKSIISVLDHLPLDEFIGQLNGAFSFRGLMTFGFYVATLFSHKVIEKFDFFPFLSLFGEPQSGKTTLTDIMNKCFFLNWPGIPLNKSTTNIGLINDFKLRKNLVTPLLEGTTKSVKAFDQGMLLNAYHWGALRLKAGSANDTTKKTTYEGGLIFVQNQEFFDTSQLKERIVSLLFSRSEMNSNTKNHLSALKKYSKQQLASIGKQILEKREEIVLEILGQVDSLSDDLIQNGITDRLSNNHAIIGSGVLAIGNIFGIEFDEKEFKKYILATADMKMETAQDEHDDAKQFFDVCSQLLNTVDPNTKAANPQLNKNEHFLIDGNDLFLRVSEIVKIAKKNKYPLASNKILFESLEMHPAFIAKNKAKKSKKWSLPNQKRQPYGQNPTTTVFDYSKIDKSIGFQTNVPVQEGGASNINAQPAQNKNSISYVGATPAIAKSLETANIPVQSSGTNVLALQTGGINIDQPIYRRSSDSKIEQWRIEVKDNKFRTISGQTDGKKTTSKWTECKGKNIGKSNATTDEEQALKEAEAKYIKQLKENYHREVADVDNARFVVPMSAHKFKDRFKGDFTNVYSQPKLDGMRCIVSKDGMFSRLGNPVLSAPHIFDALKPLFKKYPEIIIDGELYADSLKDDFSEIVSLAKKTKPTPADIAESAEKLEYWVYDIITDDVFAIRYKNLSQMLKGIPGIVIVPTQPATSQTDLDKLYQGYIAKGEEGQMVRLGNSPYEKKRSTNLLKRKEFQDAEFTITSLNEGKGNASGMIKTASLVTDDGISFDATIKGTDEYRKTLLKAPEKHIGSQATVRFQNLTPDGKPRFGVIYKIWDGKRDV
jgi:DNA ligase 1